MSRSVYRNMMVLIVGITLTVIGLGITASTTAHAGEYSGYHPPQRTRWMTVPCKQEDSLNCAWNATFEGNGVGHSFYVVRRPLENVHGKVVGRVVCVYYAAFDDRHWDACHILPKGQDGHFN